MGTVLAVLCRHAVFSAFFTFVFPMLYLNTGPETSTRHINIWWLFFLELFKYDQSLVKHSGEELINQKEITKRFHLPSS